MAAGIDKALKPFEIPQDVIDDDTPSDMLDVEIMDDAEETLDEDGNVVVSFGIEVEEEPGDHDDNIVDLLDDSELAALGSKLVASFEADRRSRSDWAKTYVNGLDLLGLKVEERSQPWQGASGVFHPLLTEAVVRFQAQAMSELYPAAGPARPKTLGEAEPEKVKRGQRVADELNYQITENMPEYRDEMEQLLFRAALAGSAFKKVYYDPILDRPCALFVPAEDLVVSYGASDLRTCPRYTHVMKRTEYEIKELQNAGFYADIDLPAPARELSDIDAKHDEIEGERPTYEDDDRYTLLEVHTMLDLDEPSAHTDGLASPYIVTVDKSSSQVLSVRRNWREDDERRRKREYFVHYKYLPGMGFYGIGLIHMIGGLAKSATSIMRQLIDAGTLSNLPAGLKARGLRVKGDNTPLRPGEFRDVDVPSGAIKDAITFLPYKEPSVVLYQLLGNVVEEGRRIGSVADLQLGSMTAQAPVGTTIALLERSMKVMSGVQARMHAAMKHELRLIAGVIGDYMGPEYDYDEEGEYNRQEDFDSRVDVIPVSDPNATTMAQRVVQYQAALQLSTQAPQLYNMGKLHRQMLEVLNIQDADEIIKLPEDIPAADPVTENMAILKQEPTKVYDYQDHEAHIAVHMAMLQDPKILQIVGQSPFASAIQSAMVSHITEHVAMQYRVEIQKQLGVEMPSDEEMLPEDAERELSRLTAMAADKLLRKNQAEAAAAQAAAQEKDPLTQIQRAELEIKAQEVEIKKMQATSAAEIKKAELELKKAQLIADTALQDERIEAENKRVGAQIGARMATQLDTNARKEKIESAKLGVKLATDLGKGDAKNGQRGRGAPNRGK